MDELLRSVAQSAKERYGARFEANGVSPKTLGWGCREDQLTRFRVMTEQIDFSGKTVMDLGCGFADFWGYLKGRDIPCSYIGVDIMEQFILHNREAHPDARFICCDVMREADQLPQADYIVSNGTLNFKIEDNLAYTERFLHTAFAKVRKGLAVDFLSTVYTPDYPPEGFVYYHDPMELLKLALSITPEVRLIHNYAPIPQKEFMIIMEKTG